MKIGIAPMEGVVDPVMREILTNIGGIDLCTTEFIRITQQVLPAHVYFRYCPELRNQGRTQAGTPVMIQLLGGDPQLLAENASFCAELGAPGIDLNFGCPAKTVNRHDGGATLLKKPERVYNVVSAVRKAVPKHLPVSAKVRLGFDHKDFSVAIAEAADQGGAAWLTVHARTKTEGYRPPAHWEYIAKMKQAVALPVFANGDIWQAEDYFRCAEISGCPDVKLGRGLIARPDLARQIKAQLAKQDFSPLTWQEIENKVLPRFVKLSLEAKGEKFALARLKQWTRLLGRTYPEAKEFFERIKRWQTLPLAG